MTDGGSGDRTPPARDRGRGDGQGAVRRCAAIAGGFLPLLLLVAALAALPGEARAQAGGEGAADGPSLDLGGLLRTGLRVGPGDLGRSDGFEIYDARLDASGEIGIVFDYFVEAEFDDRDDELELLDARLSLPIVPAVRVDLGQFRAPFGREALQDKGEITFVERSQVTQVVAPGRQVGVQLAGEALEGRLAYRGGIFNGNGRDLENEDDAFLYAGRVSYNNLGTARFFDELMVEVGASVAFSSDSAAPLAGLSEPGPGGLAASDPRVDLASFDGDRFLWGVDVDAAYRGFFLRGEYLRGELDPDLEIGIPELDEDAVAEGGYLEGGYNLWGAAEGVVRWDAMNDFLRAVDGTPVDADAPLGDESHFLVFGLNLFPGYYTKLALQYAVGLGGTDRGAALADGEFALTAQVDF